MKAHTLEVRPGAVSGHIRIPGSKSVTHRAFLLASQSIQPCTVRNPLLSGDTRATLNCLMTLGARFHFDAEAPEHIQFLPAALIPARPALDCANSGTTLRLLAGTVARLGQPTTLTGDASLMKRPNGDLLAALRNLGATISDNAGRAPLTVRGPIRSGVVTLPGPTSSQFASSLLLTLPFVQGDSTVAMQSPISSSPYLDVTKDVAQEAGLTITEKADNGRTFYVPGGQEVNAPTLKVDGDWSTAAVPLVAAAVSGGSMTVSGLNPASHQGDRRIVELLQQFGAKAMFTGDGAKIEGGALAGVATIDIAQTPDLFPLLCVLAAASRGSTSFTGGAALRVKETDRIHAMAEGLRQFGIEVQETPDGLHVQGGNMVGAAVSSYGDHRIHMALAIAALTAKGHSTINEPLTAGVSFPGFHEALERCGAPFTLLHGNQKQVST